MQISSNEHILKGTLTGLMFSTITISDAIRGLANNLNEWCRQGLRKLGVTGTERKPECTSQALRHLCSIQLKHRVDFPTPISLLENKTGAVQIQPTGCKIETSGKVTILKRI